MSYNNKNNVVWLNSNKQILFGDKSNPEYTDPLHEIASDDVDTKYHRINSVIFAEPLPNINDENDNNYKDDTENLQTDQDEITIIDNVLVKERKSRKYKKYHITMEDTASLACPQPKCNRKFAIKKLLKAHIRKVHCADKNRYICDVCGRSFACLYLLVRHGRVHTGDKVKCNICDVLLSSRTSLSAHLRTHSGIKPHTCTICKKEFARRSTLNTHVKFVHKTKELLCVQCNERFDSRSKWTRHAIQHRNNVAGGST